MRAARLLDEDEFKERVAMQSHAVQDVIPVEPLEFDGQGVRGLRREGVDGRGLLQSPPLRGRKRRALPAHLLETVRHIHRPVPVVAPGTRCGH